ncbi:acylphosphatase, partial [Bacteroidota bacterium]
FRYFVYREAVALGVTGFTKNLYSGDVQTIVEGEKVLIEDLIEKIRVGPSHASVKKCWIDWQEPKNEFNSFTISN